MKDCTVIDIDCISSDLSLRGKSKLMAQEIESTF